MDKIKNNPKINSESIDDYPLEKLIELLLYNKKLIKEDEASLNGAKKSSFDPKDLRGFIAELKTEGNQIRAAIIKKAKRKLDPLVLPDLTTATRQELEAALTFKEKFFSNAGIIIDEIRLANLDPKLIATVASNIIAACRSKNNFDPLSSNITILKKTIRERFPEAE